MGMELRNLESGLGERAGILGLGEGLHEAGGTVASCPQPLDLTCCFLKLSILGFPHRSLN